MAAAKLFFCLDLFICFSFFIFFRKCDKNVKDFIYALDDFSSQVSQQENRKYSLWP